MFAPETTTTTTEENAPVDATTAIAMNNAAQWEYYTAAAKYTKSKHMFLGVLLLVLLFIGYKIYNS